MHAAEDAVSFLEQLRPAGPWVLTAIVPDGVTATTTARTADEVRSFVSRFNGVANLYYSVNPTRGPMFKKASKTDIAVVEYALADLDPRSGETPEAAKARYLAGIKKLKLTPTAIVDSGGGLNLLMRLAEPIVLEEAVTKGTMRVFPDETKSRINAIENCSKNLMLTLDSAAGTQNIDRILRLPGTTNLPNAKKLREGHTPCQAKLLQFNGSVFRPEDFPATPEPKAQPHPGGNTKLPKRLIKLLMIPNKGEGVQHGRYESRSALLFGFMLSCLNADIDEDVCINACADDKYSGGAIYEHVTSQKNWGEYLERQFERAEKKRDEAAATAPRWKEMFDDGTPRASLRNARIAILAGGIKCSLNTFHDRMVMERSDAAAPVLPFFGSVTDASIGALRLWLANRYNIGFGERNVRDAVLLLANENSFNPVVDMLGAAEAAWDGVCRLDRVAADYFNCEDTELNQQCARKTLIAAVARARKPGCKFDTIPVLEAEEGWNKSTAWAVLAGEGNFSDEKVIGQASREVQEQLAACWIHENADLASMRKAEVETVKAHASRQVDRARPAYGRFLVEQPRHSIDVGTTNYFSDYLQSQTGNRRFWPMKMLKPIDLEKLQADRLQLWGEAAHYQSKGEALTLDERLWKAAGVEQEKRRTHNPWEDHLVGLLRYNAGSPAGNLCWLADGKELRVTTGRLFESLKIPLADQKRHAKDLAEVMRVLGWESTLIKNEGRGYKKPYEFTKKETR